MPDNADFPSHSESEAKKLIREVFEAFPLYRTLKLASPTIYEIPKILDLHCGQNVCNSKRLFELESVEPSTKAFVNHGYVPSHFGFTHSVYKCRNCGAYRYHF